MNSDIERREPVDCTPRLRVALLLDPASPGIPLADALGASPPAGHEIAVLPPALAPQLLALGGYDLIQVCGRSLPDAIAGTATATAATVATGEPRTPLVAIYAPDGDPDLYARASVILSPCPAADAELLALGIGAAAIHRWRPGVDPSRFHPARYDPDALGAELQLSSGRINLLHADPLDDERELRLLAGAFQLAHDRDCRLHLVVAGEGAHERWLRRALGPAATFLGKLDGERLAGAYATADLLVHTDAADPFGTAIAEAQASGLPVLAVDSPAASELIQSGRSGCVVAPHQLALGEAIRWLARRTTLRERLTTGGLYAARERTWERSLAQLTAAWQAALSPVPGEVARAAGDARLGADDELAPVAV